METIIAERRISGEEPGSSSRSQFCEHGRLENGYHLSSTHDVSARCNSADYPRDDLPGGPEVVCDLLLCLPHCSFFSRGSHQKEVYEPLFERARVCLVQFVH